MLAARPDRWVVAHEARGVVVKVYCRRLGFAGLMDELFGNRAERSWAVAKLALAQGIRVPEPLAYVSDHRGAAVVMRMIEHGLTVRRAEHESPSARVRRARIIALAELLRKLHEARLYPGDFHERNVLFGEDGAPALVDLDGVRRVVHLSQRRRVRNLEHLLRAFLGEHHVSRTTRLRFLVAYSRSRAEARRLWALVARRSEAKRNQYRLPPP